MTSGARKLSCFHCSTKRHFDLHQATLQFTGTISWAKYPGWCPFGRSNKSTSHSTTYRTPLSVLLAAIMVPTLRSTTARGVLTHTLSPGLTFFIYSPPSEKAAHACTEFRVSTRFRRSISRLGPQLAYGDCELGVSLFGGHRGFGLLGRNLHRSLRNSGRLQIFPSPFWHNYCPQQFLDSHASILCFRRYYLERLFPHTKHELGHRHGTSRWVSSVSFLKIRI